MIKALRFQSMTYVQDKRSDLNQPAPDNFLLVNTVVERKKNSTAPPLLPTLLAGSEPVPDDIPF